MSAQSDINKKVFVPRGETMLVAVEVRRRRRTAGRRILQLSTRGGEYATYLCLSVTNRTPPQLLITKVKQFAGSAPFVTRSQWGVDQLRQVNGIDPNKDCPDFDLVFDNTVDQWLCSSSAEKCIFILILYQAYKTYSGGPTGPPVCLPAGVGKVGAMRRMSLDAVRIAPRGPVEPPVAGGPRARTLSPRRKSCVPARGTEFINCQPKLTGEACTMNLVIYRVKAFFTRLKKRVLAKRPAPRSKGQPGHFSGGIMSNVVQRVTVSVGERGQRLTRAEDQTLELMHKAQQFADTAHKLSLKYSK
ncbi:syntaxin binding protein 6 (amisyn), like isoform X2 [Gadus morhua]|uniref:syntaxin binding protein 6 (amisyn), like isoform X2 n=1 Tax=Gadus morhua TaxID=8049 RepID=UPI0011B550CF|nr:syntaxin-binding protein 6-like isoform X2 [Gadus morhua]